MKEKYTAPELNIIRFDTEDIITTSWIYYGTCDDFPNGEDGDINIPY